MSFKITRKVLILALPIFTLFYFSGCNEVSGPPDYEELSFDPQEVLKNVPEGLKTSDNQYAAQCYSDIQFATDMSSFLSDMDVPETAERSTTKAAGDTWSWTVSDGMTSYTFYWTYDEDSEKKYWNMDIEIDGSRYEYIIASERKDGSGGEVLYNFNWVEAYQGNTGVAYEDLFWQYKWVIDNDDNYTFTWDYESPEADYNYFLNYEVVVNADGSGTIDYYSLDQPYYSMEWDSMGNGSYIYYYGGANDLRGSWTV